MKLIFNADDFGYSKAVNFGVIESYQNGVVRSATIMASRPGFYHAVGLAHLHPGLKIGVHLTMTTGRSLGGVYKTLTDSEGNFLGKPEVWRRIASGELDLAEVEAEFEAQIQKVINAGITPDHFDGHHHAHLRPGVINITLKLAKKHGVDLRLEDHSVLTGEYADIKAPAVFADEFIEDGVSLDNLKKILMQYKDAESLDLMCHPGYIDQTIYEGSPYNITRVYEVDILTSDELKDFIRKQGFELCSYSDL
jgi:predicted glycoside hydrolase/deacetylase ChbG (UPF0249 family)